MSRSAETVLLCATRFWGIGKATGSYTTPTLRAGVRSVVRKQGLSPAEIDRAERALVKRGYLRKGGKRSGASLALTEKGAKVSARVCKRVELPPWKATFGRPRSKPGTAFVIR